MNIPTLFYEMDWRHARVWIGRRLVLKERWLDVEAGTPCIVMCLVDFGDGLLFWIRTDDDAPRDVDQVTRRELETYFRIGGLPASPEHTRTNRRLTGDSESTTGSYPRPALRALAGEP